MSRDDIIRMAREAGLIRTGDGWTEPHRWGMTEIERFAALVAAAEREECAKLCEEQPAYGSSDAVAMKTDCAAAIRNRGKE